MKKSTRKNKKYMVLTPNNEWVHFGDSRYQHFKDNTPLKLYKHLDHNDPERRRLYQLRHAKTALKKYSPSYYAYNYLW